MARSWVFTKNAKTAVASGSNIFTGNDIERSSDSQTVVGYFVEHVGGTVWSLDNLASIELTVGSDIIYKMSKAAYLSWLNAAMKSKLDFSGGTLDGWPIILNLEDEEEEDVADICGLPKGVPQLTLTWDANVTGTPTVQVASLVSNIRRILNPRFQSSPTNVATAAVNQKVDLDFEGALRWFGFNNNSGHAPTRHKLYLGKDVRIEGTQQLMYGAAKTRSPLADTDPLYIKLVGMQAGPGRYEFDAAAGVAGSDEYATISYVADADARAEDALAIFNRS